MLKGGYQIIDLQNKDLTVDEGMVYEGIYDKIEGTRKVILVSGLQIDGKEYRDFFADFNNTGSIYISKIYANGVALHITVNDNDVVTIKSNI